MNKNCECIKFKNINALKKHLNKILGNLNRLTEFNVMIHQMNNRECHGFAGANEEIRIAKLASVLKYGFNLDKYGSIFGTMKLLGTEVSADDILNYNYYKDKKVFCLFALPKQISIKGHAVEFSSFKGCCSYARQPELVEEYVKLMHGTPDRHHMKNCLFDVIKGYNSLPPQYFLGIVYEDENDCFYYIDPHTHLREFSADAFKTYNKTVEESALKAFKEFDTTSLKTLIVKACIKEEKARDWSLNL